MKRQVAQQFVRTKQRPLHRTGLALALGAALATPAFAQQVAQTTEKITVTGSNIPRIEGETSLPVVTISRQQLESEGIVTAADAIDRLSSNSSIGGLNMAGSIGSTSVGYASASLRGLGGQRTLVLMNGRRLANTAFQGAMVDLNAIPLSAIERVEVLTDGASAIYGTDAIAGVINFIMRKDFRGGEVGAYYGDSEQGGGRVQRYNGTLGFGDLERDRFNAFASFDYNKTQEIRASEREFSRTSYLPNAPGGVYDRTSGNSFPGNVFFPAVPGRGGTTRSPAYPACLPPFSFPTLNAATAGQCRFDFASVIDILPPSETYNAFGQVKFRISPKHELFLEGAWQQTKSLSRSSPPPISSATLLSGDPVTVSPSSPFYPTALATQLGVNGQTLEVFWRGLELGPRTDENKIEQSRFVGGLQGQLGDWDYSTAINWSQSKATDNWLAGWARGSQLLPVLNSGRINLFGANTDAAQAELQGTLIHEKVIDSKGASTEADFRASRDLFEMAAGPLALAAGASYRREQYEFISSQTVRDADVPGLGGSISTIDPVSRNVWAAFGELNVPILRSLEANVAVRFDDYGDVGNTTNPKASLRWTPVKSLLLRTSYGTGFRAPSLPELFQPSFVGSTGGAYDDPLRCPHTGSPRDCNAQFNSQQGGNTALKPEKSKNFTAGFVLEPMTGLSFAVDYFNIKIDDVIGTPAEEPIFTNIAAAEAAGLIVRYPVGSAGCANNPASLPCPINYGIQTLVNLTQLKTEGLDLNVAYRMRPFDWGRLTATLNGTYLVKWDQQSVGEAPLHLVGRYAGGAAATVNGLGATGAFPRWKHNAALTGESGPFKLTLNQLFIGTYTDAGGARTVGSYNVWGINAAYTGFHNLILALGVKNLFDKDPPFTRQSQAFQVGYDPALTDPTGRFFYGSVRYRF